MAKYYFHYEGLLCPYSYNTCKRYITDCILPNFQEWKQYKTLHTLAQRCAYLCNSINEQEYETREFPVKKFPELSFDKNKLRLR
jgi:hypothetical protein